MIIVIPDWILFAVLLLVAWRVGRAIWRFVEYVAAAREWQRRKVDYYNMAKHRIRFEEATSGSTGPTSADAGAEALR